MKNRKMFMGNQTSFVSKDGFDYYVVNENCGLLDFLLANVNNSKSKIKATLKGKGVMVNEQCVTQFDYPLIPGMQVYVSRTKRNLIVFKSKYIKIVYEDDYIIVIEKNAGILSMEAGHTSFNVKSILNEYFKKSKQKCKAHLVHRLDRDTSGLMIYAKDMETRMILEKKWHNIVYDRRYVAVVSGEMERKEGTVRSWLKDNKAYVTYSSPYDNGGKYAVTHYNVLAIANKCSLVEYRLETGRKNQIRVHSADMGHPVCGDKKYGDGNDPINRLCLHAFRLCFKHPRNGKDMEFETPIPASFCRLFPQ